MRFNEDFIEKVLDSTDLVELIGTYTELKPKGHRHWGRCPFPDHQEKTPSFTVVGDQRYYKCFGCNRGGNAYTFLRDYNGQSFPEAVEYLAKRAGLSMPEPTNQVGPDGKRSEVTYRRTTGSEKDELHRINKLAAVYFHRQLLSLPDSHPAKKYVLSRGLSSDVVQKFRIGVALEGNGLTTFLKAQKVSMPLAKTLFLIGENDSGTQYDVFRERIIFPIFSPTEDVLGFGGRTYVGHERKYINSKDTPVFHKSKVLYGLHETSKFIRGQDQVIIVEGFMDAISLYQAGVHNVVCIQGTALTADHARMLKRYTQNVVLLLDGDEPGLKAAERSLPILLEGGLLPKGCFLPEQMDPDEFVKAKGVQALKDEINKGQELFSLILGRWIQDKRLGSSEKLSIIEKSAPLLKLIPKRDLIELYAQELSQRLEVELVWVQKALRNAWNNESAKPARPSEPTLTSEKLSVSELEAPTGFDQVVIKLAGAPKDEAFIVSLMFTDQSLFEEAVGFDVQSKLTHIGLRQVVALATLKYRQNPSHFDRLVASLTVRVDLPQVLMTALEGPASVAGLKQDAPTANADGDNRDHHDDLATTSAQAEFAVQDEYDEATQRLEARRAQLMKGYLKALHHKYLRQQARQLTSEVRSNPSPEKLEQIMNIHKELRSLEQNISE